MNNPSRREFLKSTFSTVCTAGLSGGLAESLAAAPGVSLFSAANVAPLPAPLAIKKGFVYDMLPRTLSHAERFKLARDTGFDVVQAPTTPDEHAAEELKNAATAASWKKVWLACALRSTTRSSGARTQCSSFPPS